MGTSEAGNMEGLNQLEPKLRILVVDDEPLVLSSLTNILKLYGYELQSASNGEDAVSIMKQGTTDIVISDLMMSPVNGLEILEQALQIDKLMIVILMTGYATLESAVDAIRRGAYDYLLKPFKIPEFLLTVRRATEKRRLSLQNKKLVADLKKQNAKLTETLEELKNTQKKLVHSERQAAISETIVAMKHEINNPLTTILSKIQMMQERCNSDIAGSMLESFEQIERSVTRITQILEKLDKIKEPVSTAYTENVSMLDITGSTEAKND